MEQYIRRHLLLAGLGLLWVGMQLGCQSTKKSRKDTDRPEVTSVQNKKVDRPEPTSADERAKNREQERPTTVLTQKQWKKVQSHLLEQRPEPDDPIGAKFGKKIELIGFDVDGPLVVGQQATITWYWKALDDIDNNWTIFVHFDSSRKPYRQNFDLA